MNKEDPYRKQAERRRQRITPKQFEEGKAVDREELPPRSRVHQQKRKKNKWKLKYPMIRLLVLFFILLPITIYSIYSTIAKDKLGEAEPAAGESTEGFEFVDIENAEDRESSKTKSTIEEDTKQSVEEDGYENGEATDNDEDSAVNDMEREPHHIKESEGTSSRYSEETEQKGTVYHTVKPGETIFRISMMYYKSKAGIDTIKATNNLTTNEIRVGQVLTIPLNK